MLVRLLKSNHFYNIILTPLVGALLLFASLRNNNLYLADNCLFIPPFCNYILSLELPVWGTVFCNYVLVFAIGYLLFLLNSKFALLKERTFLPTYIILFIVFAFPNLHILHPVFLSAFFILMVLYNLFDAYGKREAITNSFNAGFLTGISGIFYTPVLLLVVILPFSISTIRGKISTKEFFASLIGAFIVWLFYFAFFFMTDNTDVFINIFSDSIIFSDRSVFLQPPVIVFISFMVLLIIMASLFILKQYDTRKINTRRYYKVLAIYFFFALTLIAIPKVSIEILVIISIPLTFLLANYLTLMKRRFWADFIMFTMIALSVSVQLLLK